MGLRRRPDSQFPFLFGGTFIEGRGEEAGAGVVVYFPSFSEGLSLRAWILLPPVHPVLFPFLFGGTFIEG